MDRQEIRSDVLTLLVETEGNSHFTSDVLNGYINRAQEYLAVLIEHPRDFVDVTAEANIGVYELPDDAVLIRTAYFGDPSVASDLSPLIVTKEEILKELYPTWMDETTSAADQPKYVLLLNKKDVFLYPRPSSTYAGKTLRINYVYIPDPLSNDNDIPDLPLGFHGILKFYVLHLCYLQLGNDKMAGQMLGTFIDHKKAVQETLTKETNEGYRFQWAYQEP